MKTQTWISFWNKIYFLSHTNIFEFERLSGKQKLLCQIEFKKPDLTATGTKL